MAKEERFANKLAEVRESGEAGRADELAFRLGMNRGRYARIEAGEILPAAEELQRLTEGLGVEPERLFSATSLDAIGKPVKTSMDGRREMGELVHMLVSHDEITWLDRAAKPDGHYEVFVNMSCGTQRQPHLLLDTVAVLQKLGVSFAAGAGQSFCCGGYFLMSGHLHAAERTRARSEGHALARQASTMVHWCTQCVNVFGDAASRRALAGGDETLQHMQILDFLAERLEQLDDDVPWVRPVDRKVVVHGHPTLSPVHAKARLDVARVLRQVPGVEVVGILDPNFMDGLCGFNDAPRRAFPTTTSEMQELRHELATIVRSYGADTVSGQHQGCHRAWSPFASTDLAVRHAVSILAEALGCDHPDRVQAAALLGDPDAVVEQTRPIWMSWNLAEDRAREIAHREFGTVSAAKVDMCSCGRGSCHQETPVIDGIDVLRGVDWGTAAPASTQT